MSKGEVRIEYVKSEMNRADILTKITTTDVLKRERDLLGLPSDMR